MFIFPSASVLQEFSVQKGDICRPGWLVDEWIPPTDTEESVCLFAVCVGRQQQ